ncbi:MAG: universal stress protein [Desulfitobacteriaceae bacterium]
MFKKILVPTDASEYSRRAFATALEMARTFGAEVILLHVSYTPQAYWGYTISYGLTISQEDLYKNGEAALEATVTGFDLSGLKVSQKLEAGHPATVTIDQIEQEQVDLVVMGSHGYGPIVGSVLGSVSQRVLQRAEVPVMIVK